MHKYYHVSQDFINLGLNLAIFLGGNSHKRQKNRILQKISTFPNFNLKKYIKMRYLTITIASIDFTKLGEQIMCLENCEKCYIF